MDITRPPLDRQVSPAPWLVFRSYVDVPTAIQETLADKPTATVDEVAEILAGRGVQVSRMVVAMWLSRLKSQPNANQAAERPQDDRSNREL